MKRDMDLVRAILIALEEAQFDEGPFTITIPDHSHNEVSYHVMLLRQAGLIHAFDDSPNEGPADWQPEYLTWAGHEFLEAARDDTRWNRAKNLFKAKGAPMVFDMLKSLLVGYANQQLLG